MAQTIRDEIVPIAIPFIGENIVKEDWRHKEAATMSLACIVAGPSPHSPLANHLALALPILVKHLKEISIPLVRDTTAWTLGKIAEHFPSVIEANVEPVAEALLIGLKDSEPMVAVHACEVSPGIPFSNNLTTGSRRCNMSSLSSLTKKKRHLLSLLGSVTSSTRLLMRVIALGLQITTFAWSHTKL
jgi:hypothetical protein